MNIATILAVYAPWRRSVTVTSIRNSNASPTLENPTRKIWRIEYEPRTANWTIVLPHLLVDNCWVGIRSNLPPDRIKHTERWTHRPPELYRLEKRVWVRNRPHSFARVLPNDAPVAPTQASIISQIIQMSRRECTIHKSRIEAALRAYARLVKYHLGDGRVTLADREIVNCREEYEIFTIVRPRGWWSSPVSKICQRKRRTIDRGKLLQGY